MGRNVYDWLARARDGADAGEVERCLDEAAALARGYLEWCMIVAALGDLPSVAPAQAAALADRALESAVESGEAWGFARSRSSAGRLSTTPAGARARSRPASTRSVGVDQRL